MPPDFGLTLDAIVVTSVVDLIHEERMCLVCLMSCGAVG